MSNLTTILAADHPLDLPMPAADGLETIHYSLALAICDNVGLMFSFLAEYGERESWIADGNEIPVDAGELLTFINSNLYLVNNSK